MATQRLFLIDGSALAYRMHFAMAKHQLRTKQGEPTSAIVGFLNQLLHLLDKESPSHIAIVFDTSGPTFRHEMYAAYKANRSETPQELSTQLPRLKEILRDMGFLVFERNDAEADDIIGTLAKKASAQQLETFIVSNDKDFAQLVDPYIHLYQQGRRGAGLRLIRQDDVQEKYGVEAHQIIDYMALVGDSSDNVPGVPKVGPKTAQKLIEAHGSLDHIYESLEDMGQTALRKRLEEHEASARLSKRLVTIATDLDDLPEAHELVRGEIHEESIREWMRIIEAKALEKRILGTSKRQRPPRQDHLIQNAEDLGIFLQRAKDKEFVVIHPLAVYEEREQELHALAFALQPDEAYYLPLFQRTAHEEAEEPAQMSLLGGLSNPTTSPAPTSQATQLSLLPTEPTPNPPTTWTPQTALQQLKPMLESPSVSKLGYDLKELIIALANEGIQLQGVAHDALLASYLLNPSRNHDLASLALQELDDTKQQETDVLGTGRKKKTWRQADPAQVQNYLCEEVELLFRLIHQLQDQLDDRELADLLKNLEIPTTFVLASIERYGMALDVEMLHEMQQNLASRLTTLYDKIQEWAQDPKFKVNSSKQVAALLFEKLALHEELNVRIRKTAKGAFSTNSETLEALSEHELPQLILEYREVQKLQSTYVEALPTLAIPDPHGVPRIHTRLRQAGTATGRLSSFSPNLQNIPVRTPQGREIRKAFIPSRDDWVFLSADYSQVELRILAHMSDDPELKQAFLDGIDIHTRTASLIFQIEQAAVTSQQRSAAKAINFGIIYGMGAPRLAKQINVDIKKAEKFIRAYFRSYPKVREYLDETIESAEELGFVETILGRRRYIYELNSDDGRARAIARHIAVNTPIQGSAADLIKKAMLQIDQRMQANGLSARMLMQVHDELLFELPPSEVETFSGLLRHEMENAIQLDVPLVVDIGTGANWAEAH